MRCCSASWSSDGSWASTRRAPGKAATLCAATLARAQTPAQPDVPPVDPTFSAWSLAQLCQQKNDNVAQGECTGAIRGIIHGYQYGVLFLGQRVSMPAGETRNVSLCLRGTSVASIIDGLAKSELLLMGRRAREIYEAGFTGTWDYDRLIEIYGAALNHRRNRALPRGISP